MCRSPTYHWNVVLLAFVMMWTDCLDEWEKKVFETNNKFHPDIFFLSASFFRSDFRKDMKMIPSSICISVESWPFAGPLFFLTNFNFRLVFRFPHNWKKNTKFHLLYSMEMAFLHLTAFWVDLVLFEICISNNGKFLVHVMDHMVA